MNKENLTQEQETFCNELEQAINNCIYCVTNAKNGISKDLAKDIQETYDSFNNRYHKMVKNYYSTPIADLLVEFYGFCANVDSIVKAIDNLNTNIETLNEMIEED